MEAYLGQVLLVAFNYAPQGWAICDGRLLSIAQFDSLFQLIGTTYGGDGRETFALPDLRGRVPMHLGQGAELTNRTLGQKGGTETITLAAAQMPDHNHHVTATLKASSAPATNSSPSGGYFAKVVAADAAGRDAIINIYSQTLLNLPMKSNSIQGQVDISGNNQPHQNMQSSLVMNYIICMYGTFPHRNP